MPLSLFLFKKKNKLQIEPVREFFLKTVKFQTLNEYFGSMSNRRPQHNTDENIKRYSPNSLVKEKFWFILSQILIDSPATCFY